MVAWSPTWIWATPLLDTVVLTMYEPVDTITTWPEDEDEDEDELAVALDVEADAELPVAPENPDEPVEPVLPVEPLEPDEAAPDVDDDEDPVTCWPTVRSTDATVPDVVAVMVASVTAVWAAVTCCRDEAMLALSRAIWVVDAPSSVSVANWA